MAVTTENSTQLDNHDASPVVKNTVGDESGKFRMARFNFTQGAAAGDAGSLAYLVKIPAGRVRVILHQSRIAFSAMGAARTMDVGWLAYVDRPELETWIGYLSGTPAGYFELESQTFFLAPLFFAGFSAFEEHVIGATHTEFDLTDGRYERAQSTFARSEGEDGAHFEQPVRVDLLRRPAALD